MIGGVSHVRAVAMSAMLAGIAAAGGAWAHHSFGFYDMTANTEAVGTVVKFEWSNPHCWLFIEVPAANGPATTYGFEMQSVGELLRRGWMKNSLKPGEKIHVRYHPMKSGAPNGLAMAVLREDGTLIGKPPPGPPPGSLSGPPPAQ